MTKIIPFGTTPQMADCAEKNPAWTGSPHSHSWQFPGFKKKRKKKDYAEKSM